MLMKKKHTLVLPFRPLPYPPARPRRSCLADTYLKISYALPNQQFDMNSYSTLSLSDLSSHVPQYSEFQNWALMLLKLEP